MTNSEWVRAKVREKLGEEGARKLEHEAKLKFIAKLMPADLVKEEMRLIWLTSGMPWYNDPPFEEGQWGDIEEWPGV